MDLFLAHNLGLLWLSLGAARRLAARPADQLLAAALLGWGNLVATGLLLSLARRLGDPWWHLSVSLLLGGLTCLLVARLPHEPADPEGPTDRPHLLLLIAFGAILVALAVAGGAIACVYQPNNPDALAWQVPRALYYLGQGNLAHFDAADLRQTHLPFNHSLLQFPALVYAAPLQCLNFLNLTAWALAGVGVYRLCRLASLGANASLVACGLVLTATPAVAQAVSLTTELPAGTALVCALVFGLRWRRDQRTRHAVLAGLALGLAAGSNLNVLLGGVLAAGLFFTQARPAAPTGSRGWVGAGWLIGGLLLPFALINFLENPGWIGAYFSFVVDKLPDPVVPAWLGFWPLPATPPPLFALNEDCVGFGFTGPLFLLAAAWAVIRPRHPAGPAGGLAWLGFGWFLATVLLMWGGMAGARDFLPVLLVLSPGLAALFESVRAGRWLILVVALAAAWSSTIYLLRNNDRPLLPLLNSAFAPPALPSLPLLLEHHLSRQSRINIDTDGTDERILPFMVQGRHQRFTACRETQPDAYNLFSRATESRNAAYLHPARLPSYTLIAVPAKPTAGVEFLGTIGRRPAARDYLGLGPLAGRTAPITTNRSVLVTFYHEDANAAPDRPAMIRFRVAGLNPEDHARLVVLAADREGGRVPVASFDADGTATAQITAPFDQLVFRVLAAATGAELGSTTIAYLPSHDQDQPPIDPSLPTSTSSIFVTDVVLSKDPRALVVEGLLPVEGPFPQWDLPYLRWQRQPASVITIPPTRGFERLQLAFSVRLNVRRKAALDVLFNGQRVKNYRIDDHTAWLDQTLELTPQPGANVLEFRDAPLNNEPDWLDYLERYPDVKKHVTAIRVPLEQGAREHYEVHGRAEGRSIRTILKPEPAPDGYYFMYRNIRLEGFKKP
ncbi:MAG: hypothetical protein HYX71_06660 [Opitutae bacterium]|nr:hypothetical protein [Opitutae bacterium]